MPNISSPFGWNFHSGFGIAPIHTRGRKIYGGPKNSWGNTPNPTVSNPFVYPYVPEGTPPEAILV
jgi:hypothetical protein